MGSVLSDGPRAPAETSRLLFDRAPVLRDVVPFVELATLPTPLEVLDDGLWVKRDDLSSPHYGGNKVRKLEFVLAAPARRGSDLLTAGGVGSHHVEAVAVHGARLGLRTEAVLYARQVVEDPEEALDRLDRLGVRVHRTGSEYLMPVELLRRLRRGTHLVVPGASTPLGTLGHVEAGLELGDQLPAEVETVVAALGSGGTATGLALGLALAGHRAEVWAPLVSSRVVGNRAVLSSLEAGTRAVLAMGGLFPPRSRLRLLRGYLGRGYGVATPEADQAAALGRELGLPLERTYTAKAFAAALDARRRGRTVAFVQTWNAPRAAEQRAWPTSAGPDQRVLG